MVPAPPSPRWRQAERSMECPFGNLCPSISLTSSIVTDVAYVAVPPPTAGPGSVSTELPKAPRCDPSVLAVGLQPTPHLVRES